MWRADRGCLRRRPKPPSSAKEKREERREKRRCERPEGQCELSKLAVLLDDAKGREEREKRKEMERDGAAGSWRGADSCSTYGVARVMEKLPSRVERDWRLGG